MIFQLKFFPKTILIYVFHFIFIFSVDSIIIYKTIDWTQKGYQVVFLIKFSQSFLSDLNFLPSYPFNGLTNGGYHVFP